MGLDECRAYFENDQICLAKASLERVREGVRGCEDEEVRLRGEDLLHTHGGVAEEVDVQNDEVRGGEGVGAGDRVEIRVWDEGRVGR